MCDFSLHYVKSRPAKVGDRLTTHYFGTGTRGFAASEDANVAVCVLPGTELSFAEKVTCIPTGLFAWQRQSDKSQDRDLSANQQGKGDGASRCARISGRRDRATNIPVRRSAGYGSSVAGGAKDRHRMGSPASCRSRGLTAQIQLGHPFSRSGPSVLCRNRQMRATIGLAQLGDVRRDPPGLVVLITPER